MLVYHQWLKSEDPGTLAFLRTLSSQEAAVATNPELDDLLDYLENLCILRERLGTYQDDIDVHTTRVYWELRGIRCNCINFPILVRSVQASCYLLSYAQDVEDKKADRSQVNEQAQRVSNILFVAIRVMGSWMDMSPQVRGWTECLPRLLRWVNAWMDYSMARILVDDLINTSEAADNRGERLETLSGKDTPTTLATACVRLVRAHRLLSTKAKGEKWPRWAVTKTPSLDVPMFYRDHEGSWHSILNYASMPLSTRNAKVKPTQLEVGKTNQTMLEAVGQNNWTYWIRYYMFYTLALFHESLNEIGKSLSVHYAAIRSGVLLPSRNITEELHASILQEIQAGLVEEDSKEGAKKMSEMSSDAGVMLTKLGAQAKSRKPSECTSWVTDRVDDLELTIVE